MSGWRPALRIARRTVLRSPGRSLLVALLVAIPVAGATVADVVARTFFAPDRDAQMEIGSADAQVFMPAGSRQRILDLLPAGSRTAPAPSVHNVMVRRGDSKLEVEVAIADATEPLHRFEAELDGGAAPKRHDEALLSESLARKLGVLGGDGQVRPRSTITLADGSAITVTGLVRQQFCLSCERIAAPAGSAVAQAATKRDGEFSSKQLNLLVDLPGDTPPAGLERRLKARGFDFSPRPVFIHDDEHTDLNVNADTLRAAALVAIIVGLGLLEVILLAGTAFAVGARRQMREIGLAAANGASPRDVRRIVLAQGLVLGGLGAAIGVAAGAGVAVAARPVWESLLNEAVVNWTYGTWEIVGAGLIGLFSGLAAAIVPARGAGRMRPVDALAQRFRPVRSVSRRNALTGSGLLGAGALCGLLGDRLLADDFAAYEQALRAVATRGAYVGTPSSTDAITFIVLGGTLAVVGLVLLTPALIGWLSRLGPRLPLSGRLAARDAARHGHRTAPATAAITVVVAGSIVLAFVIAGVSRGEDLRYVERLPPGVLAVENFEGPEKGVRAVAARVQAQLPEGRAHEISSLSSHGTPLDIVARGRDACPRTLRRSGDCDTRTGEDGNVAVAMTRGLAAIASAGAVDAAARAALGDGKVVVFSAALIKAGTVIVDDGVRRTSLPGHLVRRDQAYSSLPIALVPPAVARAQGWKAKTSTVLIGFPRSTDKRAIDRALAEAGHSSSAAYVETEPSRTDDSKVLLVAGLISALVTLFGVAISVALSAADGRADLATLAAVGAPPHRRRLLVASQALVVGGLGTVLGIALGTFVAFTARATTGATGLVVPWPSVLATGIGVPLLAALVAALCTRSRLPMGRRAE